MTADASFEVEFFNEVVIAADASLTYTKTPSICRLCSVSVSRYLTALVSSRSRWKLSMARRVRSPKLLMAQLLILHSVGSQMSARSREWNEGIEARI
jgi:hypothetical protein